MIPAHFVRLDKMPLTPNGKLNRQLLPAPVKKRDSGIEYVPPQTSAEIQLTAIWEDVLGLEQVGIRDHFLRSADTPAGNGADCKNTKANACPNSFAGRLPFPNH